MNVYSRTFGPVRAGQKKMKAISMTENSSGGPGRGEIPAQAQGLAPAPVQNGPLTGQEDSADRPHPYRVIERNGWSYVVPALMVPMPHHSGPWRYKSEAEDYADDLNAGKAV